MSRLLPVLLLLAACTPAPVHRFTDVAATMPSPDARAVAALVWDEHGQGKPHISGIVVVARGDDPRDGVPVILASDDFAPIAVAWDGVSALTLRLPCGRWSSLANHAIVGGRTIVVVATPPRGCYVGRDGRGALPGPGI
jgi:hypothetical protein